MQTSKTCYDDDFYLWTQQQAILLRAEKWQDLDYGNLAEELESLGQSTKRELVNRLVVLVMHLLKWRYQPEGRRQGHSWEDTIWNNAAKSLTFLPIARVYIPGSQQTCTNDIRGRGAKPSVRCSCPMRRSLQPARGRLSKSWMTISGRKSKSIGISNAILP
jgi:hypothetical protein